MGAIASWNASAAAPSRAAITRASVSEVSGPVATIPGDGNAVTSSRTTVIRGWAVTRRVTSSLNTCRSTASAAPPGTRASSATSTNRLPNSRSSALSKPWAFVSSVDLKVLLQTISASRSVRCAGVPTPGRISCSVTAMPRSASAQAASQPARPPPTTLALTT